MAERTIRDIIQGQELLTAPPAMTVAEAARQMRQRNVGAMMVVDGGRLAGIFTERDALFRVVAAGLDSGSTTLATVMTANPVSITAEHPFADALAMMHEGRFRHLPVTEQGRPVGMISVRDALGPELESFVYELLREEQVSQILA
ncbi:MAG: CBS domain-containing protein [Betaproteobacteria bacterium]|jgi:CBS domain-containing protein|nr:CBS domain-containing protein [Betaproteobacteria bacterium]